MTKKKCPPITLESIRSGGYLLTYLGDNNDVFYKQKYFYYTQKQARKLFWDYLQGQGISDS